MKTTIFRICVNIQCIIQCSNPPGLCTLWIMILSRFGPGSSKRHSGGETINRLQELAGGGHSSGKSPKRERQRSRSPRESRRPPHSSFRRSRSRERNERQRSRERISPEHLQRRPSIDDYVQQQSPPSRSFHRRSRSKSRSPPMRARDDGER